MLYIITSIFFLIWAIWIIRKGRLSWHTVVSIYAVVVFATDWGDVPFDYWFNFYDLPIHLLENIDTGHYLAIALSDGVIFPLIAIIFCYYASRNNHHWLLSILFSALIGVIEVIYVKLGYMIYYYWHHLTTPIILLVLFRILAHYSNRFINYSPPVYYPFRLLCCVYVITEWPGTIIEGILHMYQYRPHIFNNDTADARFVSNSFAALMGVVVAIFAPKIRDRYRISLFMTLGLGSILFALLMYSKGFLLYNNYWNHTLTIIRYITPYSLVYLYDKWESVYTLNAMVSYD